MKNTIKLVLAMFVFSSVFINSCQKVDFKEIIEKVRDDKGDRDRDDDKDRDDDRDRDDDDEDEDEEEDREGRR